MLGGVGLASGGLRAGRGRVSEIQPLLRYLFNGNVELLRQKCIRAVRRRIELVIRQQRTSCEVRRTLIRVRPRQVARRDAQSEEREAEDPPPQRMVGLKRRYAGIELDAVLEHRGGWLVGVSNDDHAQP